MTGVAVGERGKQNKGAFDKSDREPLVFRGGFAEFITATGSKSGEGSAALTLEKTVAVKMISNDIVVIIKYCPCHLIIRF